ncbi:MAG: hypothetical protein DMD87_14435 [Candidatus Rokuibacteriota bacterium]|nr:MAG: hypothetical protein DMD87_14435 [Candidatus Rokubacteria bacterium]
MTSAAVVRVAVVVTGLVLVASCQSLFPPKPDPQRELVARGKELFLKETFAGNGRTCGTCHPPTNNFTIDSAFISRLPPNDPLFVAEFVPALRENFEKPELMRKFGLILENLDGFVLLFGGALAADGQEATEFYIPVGQSPGLSGKVTVIGTVETADARGRTIVVAGPSGKRTAAITDRTKIWLDRSKLGQQNQKGTFADLGKGAVVEVKYEDKEPRVRAEWVKVEMAAR